ncbi:MAG: hypothetical protein MHM6MM_004944, partial [Cercozoa sp. M6MM]
VIAQTPARSAFDDPDIVDLTTLDDEDDLDIGAALNVGDITEEGEPDSDTEVDDGSVSGDESVADDASAVADRVASPSVHSHDATGGVSHFVSNDGLDLDLDDTNAQLDDINNDTVNNHNNNNDNDLSTLSDFVVNDSVIDPGDRTRQLQQEVLDDMPTQIRDHPMLGGVGGADTVSEGDSGNDTQVDSDESDTHKQQADIVLLVGEFVSADNTETIDDVTLAPTDGDIEDASPFLFDDKDGAASNEENAPTHACIDASNDDIDNSNSNSNNSGLSNNRENSNPNLLNSSSAFASPVARRRSPPLDVRCSLWGMYVRTRVTGM